MRITGISWVFADRYGTARLERRGTHGGLRDLYEILRTDTTLTAPFSHFGRFDRNSRGVCLCVALALQDAGVACHGDAGHDMGLLVHSTDGAAHANATYFQDYAEGGRKLGRANLFIYTLPTSPAAEAAIHFGLTGPVLYVGRPALTPCDALFDSAGIIRGGHTAAMLCIVLADSAVVCAVGQGNPAPSQTSIALEQAAGVIERLIHDQTEHDAPFISPAAEKKADVTT